jgi:hypothetical protein
LPGYPPAGGITAKKAAARRTYGVLGCPRAANKGWPHAACKAFFCHSRPEIAPGIPSGWLHATAKKPLDFLSAEVHKLDATYYNAMKSKKNLTRFTYESAAFEGWRLCISRAGTTFTRYFPDKKFGGGKKSLAAAEKALTSLKELLDGAKKVDGKLSPTTVKKAEKLLAEAV